MPIGILIGVARAATMANAKSLGPLLRVSEGVAVTAVEVSAASYMIGSALRRK